MKPVRALSAFETAERLQRLDIPGSSPRGLEFGEPRRVPAGYRVPCLPTKSGGVCHWGIGWFHKLQPWPAGLDLNLLVSLLKIPGVC